MKFPIQPNSPEWKLAEAIATDLCIDGFDPGQCMPVAIHIMAVVDAAHDDPLVGVTQIKENRKRSDEWWIKYHPNTKTAKAAKLRLKQNPGN